MGEEGSYARFRNFNSYECTVLEKAYKHNPCLTKAIRVKLAKLLHRSERGIQKWYERQNLEGEKRIHKNGSGKYSG